MCGLCFGFFEGRYISRHQYICKVNSSQIITSLPVTLIHPISNVTISDDFKMKILATFQGDPLVKDVRQILQLLLLDCVYTTR